ncbi:hypothetical protein EHEL_081330 [Encephalitozoon hellem ATCC 50504]|uniref:UDP-N-acetylglucosamine--peptide N-acetylglucosaminyltransferase n=1 Tax=Encephalitozoon hellem TaxID=27973 RepID=A0A9Q9C444_ENCHE|nr:uncharacterized protein EHEL_081330 [Encephalitozoon hellem ATCC 50504]AFM98833.1 hypothetical protein EHEL_081330 [Encephalitozoon hellem ATCC 50504]UTX43811.1 UDP-N-acetylglucosamine--peptide N- acetylglucosaminyltransferase [Encephalitozoon hellem]|eukprot:XP_003887814.1 hypothetical protein EHEL_081330 [Encephalitozoon hellem ATCC 50504]
MGGVQIGGKIGRSMDGENSMGKSRNAHLDLEAIARCCEDALKANPCNSEALYSLGKYHIENKNIDEAEVIAARLFELESESYEGCVLSGYIGLQRIRLDKSYENFVKAYYKAEYKDKFLMYGISLFYEAIGDYMSARPWFVLLNKLGVEEYKSYETLFRTGVCLKKMSRLQDSINVFRVIVYDPLSNAYNPDVQIQIAHLYEMQSKHELAFEVLRGIEKSERHNLIVSRLCAWLDYKIGNFRGVKRRYRSDSIASNDPYLLYLVGRIRYIERNYMGALRKYMRAAQMDSMEGMVHNSIGCTYFRQGKLLLAKTAFMNALEVNPKLSEASINLKLIEKIVPPNKKETTESMDSTLYNPREPPPAIGKTRYLDSGVFFKDPAYNTHPRVFRIILPMKASKFELLPGRF